MKYIAKVTIVSLVLFCSCKKGDDLFDNGGPITRYLLGRWTVTKVVTPSQTKVGSQIGYNQIMIIGNNGVDDFDKIFKDTLLITTHIWARNVTGSAATSTVILNYTDGLQRSFKILEESGKTMLQASEYLKEVGSPQDTVLYYYKSAN